MKKGKLLDSRSISLGFANYQCSEVTYNIRLWSKNSYCFFKPFIITIINALPSNAFEYLNSAICSWPVHMHRSHALNVSIFISFGMWTSTENHYADIFLVSERYVLPLSKKEHIRKSLTKTNGEITYATLIIQYPEKKSYYHSTHILNKRINKIHILFTELKKKKKIILYLWPHYCLDY